MPNISNASSVNGDAPSHAVPPVLFLIFNRPNVTAQSFQSIAQAKPERLYVAADGPRRNKAGENVLCEQARQIATAVNWPCEVKTLFREKNLGCKRAVSSAIDWFFAQEQEGIVLEDDCLAHPDFFKYCAWALEKYRSDKEIWHINGNNFCAPDFMYDGKQTAFVSLAQVWGWATWADRWRFYESNPFYLRRQSRKNSKKWHVSFLAKYSKQEHIHRLVKGLDTWDYQWQITVLNNEGLVLTPSSNLISNHGDGNDATHTRNDKRARSATKAFTVKDIDNSKVVNRRLQTWYERRMHLRSFPGFAKILGYKLGTGAQKLLRDSLARFFFKECSPIVIASTGRSGSTFVFRAIAESLVADKYKNFQRIPFVRALFISLSSCYLDRLSDMHACPSPIKKTHALFEERYARDAKFLFIFGPPFDAAISAHMVSEKFGDIWLDEHLFHLESVGEADQIYEQDILRYEDQINIWSKARSSGVLCIHYSDLWEKEAVISAFVGFNVTLPPKEERAPKPEPIYFDPCLFERLQKDEYRLRSTL